jgi:hypothetical protein
MSPTMDGRYALHLTVTRQMHNQHLSCSALNSAGISEDVVVLAINCMLFLFGSIYYRKVSVCF